MARFATVLVLAVAVLAMSSVEAQNPLADLTNAVTGAMNATTSALTNAANTVGNATRNAVNGTRNAFDTAANTTRAATATVVNATRAATANVTLDEDDLAGNHTADDGHDHSQDMVNDTVVAATAPKQSGAGSVAAGATVMAAAFMGSALLLLL